MAKVTFQTAKMLIFGISVGFYKSHPAIFLYKNIFCDPSLEPSRRDGSNEGSQHMFSLRNKKLIFELFLIPPLICSSEINKTHFFLFVSSAVDRSQKSFEDMKRTGDKYHTLKSSTKNESGKLNSISFAVHDLLLVSSKTITLKAPITTAADDIHK